MEGLLTLSRNSTLDNLVERYNSEMSKIVDKCAPIKSKRVTRRERLSWYDDELYNLKKTVRGAERLWKTTRMDRDKYVHSTLLARYRKALKISQIQVNQQQNKEKWIRYEKAVFCS